MLLLEALTCPEVLCENGVLKHLTRSTGKYLYQILFFNKAAGFKTAILLKRETLTQVFSCEFCEIFKNTFLLKNTSGGCFYTVVDPLLHQLAIDVTFSNHFIDSCFPVTVSFNTDGQVILITSWIHAVFIFVFIPGKMHLGLPFYILQ